MRHIIFLIALFFCLCGFTKGGDKPAITTLCIVGTEHDSSAFINSAKIYDVIKRIAPDVILYEFEEDGFTGNTFNLQKYPGFLCTNESKACYRYQKEYGIDIRPYDIEGRNKHYRDTKFDENSEKLVKMITTAYEGKTLSAESAREWKRHLKVVPLLDIATGYTLEDINTSLFVRISEAKNNLTFNALIYITQRDFPDWVDIVTEWQDFWDKRNRVMTEKILNNCKNYPGKKILVLTGQEHKSQLLKYLEPHIVTNNIILREFHEF